MVEEGIQLPLVREPKILMKGEYLKKDLFRNEGMENECANNHLLTFQGKVMVESLENEEQHLQSSQRGAWRTVKTYS